MKTLGRGAINVVEADIRYVERYVGDVAVRVNSVETRGTSQCY